MWVGKVPWGVACLLGASDLGSWASYGRPLLIFDNFGYACGQVVANSTRDPLLCLFSSTESPNAWRGDLKIVGSGGVWAALDALWTVVW